jgi:prepilin-type processing-associated H-X9-DG protein
MLAAIGVVQGQLFERQRRVKCANNLRQIGLAAMMYANEEVRTGAFPRTHFNPDTADKPTAFSNPTAPHPFKEGAPGPNDVTSGLYLLQRTQEITPDVFACPSSKARALKFARPATDDEIKKGPKPAAGAKKQGDKVDAESIAHLSNFPSADFLSYGYNNPYPSKAAIADGWKFNNSLGPDFVFAADVGPAADVTAAITPKSPKAELAKANSPNHGDGQNVVYADCHVEFQMTPFAGPPREKDGNRDNIYAPYRAGGGGPAAGDPVMGPANDPFDAVVLPPTSFAGGGTTKPAK